MCTHLVRRLRPHLQRLVGRFLGVCLAGNVAACASEGRGAGWAGTVDTLPGGAVAVRSPSEGLWTPDTRWRLVEELRIGSIEAEGPELFGSVAGLAVDSAGRIYVLDRQAKEVRAFDAAGAFLRRIGREGGGPGELGDPIALAIGPEGSLLVVDVGNGRYARFDTSGAYLGSTRREVGGYVVPARVGFDPRGRFHEGARVRFGEDFGAAILRFESGLTDPHAFRIPEWETDEYVLTRGEMRMTAEVPFAPRLVWALDPGGGYWTAVTDRMRFVRHAMDGDTLRIVERAFDPIRATAADRDRAVEGLRWFTRQGGRVDPSRMPETRPQFQRFTVTPDGYLWVLVTRRPPGVAHRFDVYDPRGAYLGAVDTDLALGPWPLVVGDRVYGRTADSLGVTYVVRARIESGG